MEQKDNRVHFRKTLYFKMVVVTVFLGFTFFLALGFIYQLSTERFRKEMTAQSDALTEQICQNVETVLKELAEKTVPLVTTNERIAPLISDIRPRHNVYDPYRMIRVRQNLDELIGMNGESNWMAVVDRAERVYLSYRLSASVRYIPDWNDILSLYQANYERLNSRPGTIVWAASNGPGGIILMRHIFNSATMEFVGTIMAEVSSQPVQSIFANSHMDKAGDFALCDAYGNVICSTYQDQEENLSVQNIREESLSDDPKSIETEYPINKGKLKILHTVDLEEKNQKYTDLLRLIVWIGLFVYVAIILFLWFTFGRMAQNMKVMLENINRISRGEFELVPLRFPEGDELDILEKNISRMAVRIRRLMNQVVHDREQKQKNEYSLLETRYHELQAQVNPHVLFNILQSINGTAQIEGDMRVSRQICLLAKFFRGNIDRSYTFCTLGEEMDYAENYLKLYMDIYQERLNMEIQVEEPLKYAKIPTYILQPVVENAVVHGMEPSLKPCMVRIRAVREGEKMCIHVWDNGVGIDTEKLLSLQTGKAQSRRIGLRNVQERIRILYGEGYGLKIDSRQNEFTEVVLTLPVRSEDQP